MKWRDRGITRMQPFGGFVPFESRESLLRQIIGEMVTTLTRASREAGIELPKFRCQVNEINFWNGPRGRAIIRRMISVESERP